MLRKFLKLFSGKSTGRSEALAMDQGREVKVTFTPYNQPKPQDNQPQPKLQDTHVIRLKEPAPKGFRRKLHNNLAVAGVSQRQPALRSFISGSDRKVSLQAQPDNQHDPKAVAVLGEWTLKGETTGAQLGFLPKDVAAEVQPLVESEAIIPTLEALFQPRDSKSAGLRIHLWTRAAKPKKRKTAEELPYNARYRVPGDEFKRNVKGQELEKKGLVENAIKCYEANVSSRFDGDFPYNRLAIIYRRRKAFGEEVRVLNEAIEVFETLRKTSPRSDIEPKLEKFQERLKKAEKLLQKQV